jgi:hypothetical protein
MGGPNRLALMRARDLENHSEKKTRTPPPQDSGPKSRDPPWIRPEPS